MSDKGDKNDKVVSKDDAAIAPSMTDILAQLAEMKAQAAADRARAADAEKKLQAMDKRTGARAAREVVARHCNNCGGTVAEGEKCAKHPHETINGLDVDGNIVAEY